MARDEGGFTLVEILVALSIFAVVSTGFYMVLFQSADGAATARNVTGVTQEAQLGFNRMVRDTRQAERVTAADPNSFTIEVDFDGDGAITPAEQTNSQGDFEVLTYSYSNSAHEIRLNGETLMKGVHCLTKADGSCYPVFDYSSDHLEYDANQDGITTWQELDSSGVAGVGNSDGILDGPELPYITNVSFGMRVQEGGSSATFADQVQLRNER